MPHCLLYIYQIFNDILKTGMLEQELLGSFRAAGAAMYTRQGGIANGGSWPPHHTRLFPEGGLWGREGFPTAAQNRPGRATGPFPAGVGGYGILRTGSRITSPGRGDAHGRLLEVSCRSQSTPATCHRSHLNCLGRRSYMRIRVPIHASGRSAHFVGRRRIFCAGGAR